MVDKEIICYFPKHLCGQNSTGEFPALIFGMQILICESILLNWEYFGPLAGLAKDGIKLAGDRYD